MSLTTSTLSPRLPGRSSRGFSLVEMMVAIAIGLILLAVLATIFANMSRNQKELTAQAQQIENGRYALDTLTDEIHHAGFFGYYVTPTATTPGALPDPCALDAVTLKTALALPLQGYNGGGAFTLPSCIAAGNYLAGTDILVIRRAATSPTPSASLNGNLVYVQGDAGANGGTGPVVATGANPALFNLTVRNGTGSNVGAPIFQLLTHIYYVSRCSVPSASGGTVCAASDDGGAPIPTLKRVELGLNGSGVLVMAEVPVAEGIENFQVDYGLDTDGDGAPDAAPVADPGSVASWQQVVALKVSLLARNPQASAGYTDVKTYDLGTAGSVTPGDNYRRHMYVSELRARNVGDRLETP